MKSLKSMLGSKDSDSKAKNATSHQLSDEKDIWYQQVLTPGNYGHFTSSPYSIYFAGTSSDKGSSLYGLCEDGTDTIYAFAMHDGLENHEITLHSQNNFASEPLGFVGVDGLLSSTALIMLPTPTGSIAPNQIEKLKHGRSLSKESSKFSVSVASGDVEKFQWRGGQRGMNPLELKLLRLKNPQTRQKKEVVGLWTAEEHPEQHGKLGTFQFQGSGATGELGEYWTLMAVMSLLRVCQSRQRLEAGKKVLPEMVVATILVGLAATAL